MALGENENQIWQQCIAGVDDIVSDFSPVKVRLSYDPLSTEDIIAAVLDSREMGLIDNDEVDRAYCFIGDLCVHNDAAGVIAELPRESGPDGSQYVILKFPSSDEQAMLEKDIENEAIKQAANHSYIKKAVYDDMVERSYRSSQMVNAALQPSFICHNLGEKHKKAVIDLAELLIVEEIFAQ